MPVLFQNADIAFKLQAKSALKKFIAVSFDAEAKKKLSVAYIFCSDDYLLRINQDFLKHDYYTDIITFPLSVSDAKVEAEIYISIDRVRDNALKLKTSFDRELLRVIFHGILHLMGYQDKTPAQKEDMRLAEDKWIKRFESES